MGAYDYLSRAYGKLMSDVDYKSWAGYIDSFLKDKGEHRIYETACGTGLITFELYRMGYEITAADISGGMLNEAVDIARKKGYQISFVKQDMKNIETGRKFDAVISACDGPNCIDIEGISRFAASSYNSVKRGGLLLFDISTGYKLRSMDGQIYYDDREDLSCIWKCEFDENLNALHMDVTLFIRNGSVFERYSEKHTQYVHEEEQVRSILLSTGFSSIEVYECFTSNSPKENSQRVQFVCGRE